MNNINFYFPYDYIITVIIFIIVIFCTWRGFIQSLLGLLTWVGSILITIYSYNAFANFITKELLNINIFQNYESITNFGSMIIAIPLIFLISLFILKRIKLLISADLDKKILGIIFDKFFGLIYGMIFSYAIIIAMILVLERFEFNNLNQWMNSNSKIISSVNQLNLKIIEIINPQEKTDIN